jgi:hypothetical protein
VATVVRIGVLDIDVLAVLTAQDGRDRLPVVGRAYDQSVDILVVEHPAEDAEDDTWDGPLLLFDLGDSFVEPAGIDVDQRLIRTPSIAAKSRITVPARLTNSCQTSVSRRIPPHDARPPRELPARGARSQASDLGTNGDRPTTFRAWPCKLAPRLPPWSRAARTSPPTSLEPSDIRNLCDWYYATQLLHDMQNKDWQRQDVWVRVGLMAMQVTGASCTRWSWGPFATQPNLWARKAGRLFLTSLALEVYHRSLLVYRPTDTDPVLPAAVADDERKAAPEPDAGAPAPSPEAKPDMAALVLEPSRAKS